MTGSSKKKQKQTKFEETPKAPASRETAFIIRKLSIRDWQRIDLVIEGDKVVSRVEREPNLSAIVWYWLFNFIRTGKDRSASRC